MDTYILAADLGGTTVKLGLFSGTGSLLEKWEIPTDKADQGSHILPDIAAALTAKLTQRGIAHQQVAGLGLCVPGVVDAQCVINKCVNLGWGIVDLKAQLGELLPGIPNIAAENDANVAALGELWQGGGKGFQSAVLLTLGTGLGGGVVVNGRIIAGANGGAGEPGHITMEPGERAVCGCGKRGCLEQYVSAVGIVRMGREMMTHCETPSALRDMADLTSKEICDAARAGDAMAVSILDRWGEYLGRAMSYIACTVDPEVFLLGGGMSRAGDLLIDAVKPYYQRYAFHASTETPIKIAQLGNDAGIFGCARLILNSRAG